MAAMGNTWQAGSLGEFNLLRPHGELAQALSVSHTQSEAQIRLRSSPSFARTVLFEAALQADTPPSHPTEHLTYARLHSSDVEQRLRLRQPGTYFLAANQGSNECTVGARQIINSNEN